MINSPNSPVGQHILLDLYQCNDQLSDVDWIEEVMLEAAKRSGATIVDTRFHAFSPQGVSGMVIIKESHLSIHTWPEHNFASVDIYTCGETLDFDKAVTWLKETLNSQNCVQKHFVRGNYIIDEKIPTHESAF
jgi:S-adenosylmethionine decarboxylase proenzyme